MSDRDCELPRSSSTEKNCIPSGRQLLRTPLTEGKRHRDLSYGDSDEESQEDTKGKQIGTRDRANDLSGTVDVGGAETRAEDILEPDHLKSMLKGMQGYQPTADDLEFIKRMKEEELLRKLQGDLEEMKRLLKSETMALEQVCASRDLAKAEINKLPSCEELAEWAQVVLEMTLPSDRLKGLDAKSLLVMVTKEQVQRAKDEKRIELKRMEKTLENKRKKFIEDKGQLEKRISTEQVNIRKLMSQLSDLASELAQEEETYEFLQMQITTKGVQRQGKRRNKKPTGKMQETANHPVAPADGGEEAQNVVLRRSKRIACRQ